MLCKICKSEFEQNHYNQKYCSVACKIQAIRDSKAKYRLSEKGKINNKKWVNSEKRKNNEKRYRQNEKGKMRNRRASRKYYQKHKNEESFKIKKRELYKKYVAKNYDDLRKKNNLATKKYRATENGKFAQRASKLNHRADVKVDIQFIRDILTKSQHCHYCGKSLNYSEKTIDHKTPVSKGGTNDKDNLVVACRNCNCYRKLDKIYDEFMEEIKGEDQMQLRI